jgi:Ca-activated chloride channel homolog
MIFINAKMLFWLFALAGGLALQFYLYRSRKPFLSLMLKGWDRNRYYLRQGFFFSAILFLILALAQPQWGKREEVLNASGMDIVFAIDVSRSMMLKDVPPTRLGSMKYALDLLINGLAGNRLALVAFAGSSYIECPLTPISARF